MSIWIATASDLENWTKLRARLWKDTPHNQHRSETIKMLAKPAGESVAFLDATHGNVVRAFAEAALRHGHVNGCQTSPVAFLEGIYVRPEDRGSGIGTRLLIAVQSWAREQGCGELASDADLENLASHAFHATVGFVETKRVVDFRKPL